jgi:hypothetical protein
MRKFFTILSFCLFALFSYSQTVTISGYISDESSGERLINSSVYLPQLQKGAVSNNFGFYSLSVPKGRHELICSFVGYSPEKLDISSNRDTVINFRIKPNALLNEVIVTSEKNNSKVLNAQLSKTDISMAKIKSLPAFLGEADVIKTIQLLPGVQAGTEGSSGLYVRGGGPDQNLILLDDVPVYNTDHLLGFFSVFNSDAIKNISFYKGDFPARFGGRLSSVLDIRTKDGNEQKLHGNFSIGLISSKLKLEGPIVKGKTTFNFSARRTYLDLVARPLIKSATNNETTAGYFFHDLNMKISHKFSDKSRLYLSLYNGLDKAYARSEYDYTEITNTSLRDKDDASLKWGNLTTALKWNYVLSNKLFMNATLIFSNYKFDVSNNSETKNRNNNTVETSSGLNYISGIKDLGLKADFDYFPLTGNRVKFGVQATNHFFRPGIFAYSDKVSEQEGTNIDKTYKDRNINTQELAIFAEDNFDLTSKLSVNAGLHSSVFLVDGKLYPSLQPRLSARYLVSDRFSLKAAYAKMSQNIHLLSSSTINLPTDLWLPTTKRVKPQNAHQLTVGGVYQLKTGLDFSVEGFYKKMTNLLEYKEGASFAGVSTGWEDKVEMGKGWSYGTEFLLEKTMGKTTGWIGYTLSWAQRQFENLNFGEKYFARYDRRHDVSFVLTHKFSNRFDVGLTWVYATGNAVTLPTQVVDGLNIGGNTIQYEYFGNRNNYRMPAYHRMDIGFNFHKQKRHGVRTWNISFYNAYSRQNPFFMFFQNVDQSFDPNDQASGNYRVLKQVSLFPIIPSFSYSYKF